MDYVKRGQGHHEGVNLGKVQAQVKLTQELRRRRRRFEGGAPLRTCSFGDSLQEQTAWMGRFGLRPEHTCQPVPTPWPPATAALDALFWISLIPATLNPA
jgi:hypothetical protein